MTQKSPLLKGVVGPGVRTCFLGHPIVAGNITYRKKGQRRIARCRACHNRREAIGIARRRAAEGCQAKSIFTCRCAKTWGRAPMARKKNHYHHATLRVALEIHHVLRLRGKLEPQEFLARLSQRARNATDRRL